MTLTLDEEKAIAWAIAMIRPRDDKYNESMSSQIANTLQGILDKARGEKNEPS